MPACSSCLHEVDAIYAGVGDGEQPFAACGFEVPGDDAARFGDDRFGDDAARFGDDTERGAVMPTASR